MEFVVAATLHPVANEELVTQLGLALPGIDAAHNTMTSVAVLMEQPEKEEEGGDEDAVELLRDEVGLVTAADEDGSGSELGSGVGLHHFQ